jgi:DNA-binding MarR family transcriptional regulator
VPKTQPKSTCDTPPESLTPEQTHLWRTFRKAWDRLGESVNRRLTEATGLSAPEYGVLSLLEELGGGTARQSALTLTAGWDKSRTSHLLRRMEGNGLVERYPVGGKGVTVTVTERGRTLARQGQPVHARAVREHFFNKLRPDQLAVLLEIAGQLEGEPSTDSTPLPLRTNGASVGEPQDHIAPEPTSRISPASRGRLNRPPK